MRLGERMWPDETVIGALRVRGARDNTPALRLGLANLLNTTDLRPVGVSPSAVLIVRHMADPLPGRLAPHRPAVRVDAAWERAMHNALTDLYHTAARPATGYVPADAKAVLFADEAEMLACLAFDVSRGQAWARWWWQMVLRTWSVGDLAELLCHQAMHLPATLQHLVRWGQAVAVIQTLSSERALMVLSALSQTYNLPDPNAQPASRAQIAPGKEEPQASEEKTRQQEQQPTARVEATSSAGIPGHRSRFRSARRSSSAPWAAWLAPVATPGSLGKAQECLLGLGLILYHQPAVVHTDKFRRALAAWWTDRGEASTAGHEGPSVSPLSSPLAPRRASQTAALATQMPMKVSDASSGRGRTDADGLESAQLPEDTQAAPGQAVGENKREAMAGPVDQRHLHPIERPETIVSPQETSEATQEEIRSLLAEGVTTRLGGALYLINFMQYLDLPACFEKDWGLVSQIGPWGTLELLTRALLGPAGEQFATDVLWTVLAELAGHNANELPGTDFCGADCFHLPPGWVHLAENEAVFWVAHRARLYLWAEAGYLLVDCERRTMPKSQAKAELRPYLSPGTAVNLFGKSTARGPPDGLKRPLLEGLNPQLLHWLEWVWPYVRIRLSQALGGRQDVAQAVLLYPARLYVTSSHIDLVMSLDDISLPVRLAGLDRDPGWLPTWGRVVKFHFE